MSHDYHPRTVALNPGNEEEQLASDEPLFFDGCADCEEKVNPLLQSPLLASLLWRKMVRVDFLDQGRYRSDTEAKAGHKLYEMAVWIERNLRYRITEDGLVRVVEVR